MGRQGRLTLDAPVLTPIVAMIGGAGPSGAVVAARGGDAAFGRGVVAAGSDRGPWNRQALTDGSLRVIEGGGMQAAPDLVSVVAAFARMDLNELLGCGGAGQAGRGAEMSLAVEREPGTLIDAQGDGGAADL